MCTERTDAELAFVDATAHRLRADAERFEARAEWREASERLRAEGKGNDIELIMTLTDEAVAQTGLPEDNEAVDRLREAVADTLKVAEAVAGGLDIQAAAVAVQLGIDPRTIDPGPRRQVGGYDI